MDLSLLTNESLSPLSQPKDGQRDLEAGRLSYPNEEARRKRRAIDMNPDQDLPAIHHRGKAQSISRGTQIESILGRLSKVEEELAMLKQPPTDSSAYTSDTASRRSILAPAMQGSSDPRAQMSLSAHQETTPIYGEPEQLYGSNFMDSLSLRRDLLSPENPPFGIWWTYTVEETLVWPILEFDGEINSGLDAVLDLSDEDDGERSSKAAYGPGPGRLPAGPNHVGRVRKGLDDGDTVQELIESFLENVHIHNPVLDTAKLQSYVSNFIENGLGWDGETCQVLLACALGAVSCPWNAIDLQNFSHAILSPQRSAIGREYFCAAQKRLGALWSRSSLVSTQCLFMTGIYFMYTQQPVSGWRAFNSATIACRSHISKRIAGQNKAVIRPDTRNLEQRLGWSCIKSEREVACEFGMETSGLNLLAYSTTLPTPPNGVASESREISQNSPLNRPRPLEDESWYYYLTEIMLRKLQMRIDIFFQNKRREAYQRAGDSAEKFFHGMVEALKEFDFQLKSYYETLPPFMFFSLEDLTPCSDGLRHFLRWRLLCVNHDITLPAFYILLHNDVSRWSRDLVAEIVRLANACLLLDIKILRSSIITYRHQNISRKAGDTEVARA
ncbi:uncharacterized protein RCO7_02976 [Rhynchosporium graminicola]|uniref:Xylanolytic transcriptional activator regulatory domain-containing protein n=1 Tax=Rhynchosporium graminicola TaxID=2792576 RepID=A0A1E1KR42_9HELO|nr:uncharacterized protein RCO7_02976 [Rhynchosporium commune]